MRARECESAVRAVISSHEAAPGAPVSRVGTVGRGVEDIVSAVVAALGDRRIIPAKE